MSDLFLELTPREREVLDLIAQDLTNREIAQLLVISIDTVQCHVSHILARLGVRSRHQAADLWRDRTG